MKKIIVPICLLVVVFILLGMFFVKGSNSNQNLKGLIGNYLGEPNEIVEGVYLYRGYVGLPESIEHYWVSITKSSRGPFVDEVYFANSQGYECVFPETSQGVGLAYVDCDGDSRIDFVSVYFRNPSSVRLGNEYCRKEGPAWKRTKYNNEGFYSLDNLLSETRAKYIQYIPFETIEKKKHPGLMTSKIKREATFEDTEKKISFPIKNKN